MALRLVKGMGLSLCLLASGPLSAGEFDRLEGDTLARLTQGEGVRRHERLEFADLEGLPSVLSDTRSAFLVVKTGQGNYARVLATSGLQKRPDDESGAMTKAGAGKMVKAQAGALPVLVLERFETFEPGKSGSRLSKGQGLILYEGFRIDLDTGQVVPAGQGGDVGFVKEGDAAPALISLGKAVIYSLTKPVATSAPPAAEPSPGKTVLPSDFAGRYHLQADGRWSGLLELQVAPNRGLTGHFRSQANGTSYPVSGQILMESPQKAEFTIKFPRVEQEYAAFLWTEGKNVISGSFTMQDRTFGFYAVREGTRASPPE